MLTRFAFIGPGGGSFAHDEKIKIPSKSVTWCPLSRNSFKSAAAVI